MRISDWSSDVCSSDLVGEGARPATRRERDLGRARGRARGEGDRVIVGDREAAARIGAVEITVRMAGRARAHRTVDADVCAPGCASIVIMDLHAATVGVPGERTSDGTG